MEPVINGMWAPVAQFVVRGGAYRATRDFVQVHVVVFERNALNRQVFTGIRLMRKVQNG
jgi:hypothetical protein